MKFMPQEPEKKYTLVKLKVALLTKIEEHTSHKA
jgi:hypothetical protein